MNDSLVLCFLPGSCSLATVFFYTKLSATHAHSATTCFCVCLSIGSRPGCRGATLERISRRRFARQSFQCWGDWRAFKMCWSAHCRWGAV